MELTIKGEPKEIAAFLLEAEKRQEVKNACADETHKELSERVEAIENRLDAARSALKPKFVSEMCTDGVVTKSKGQSVWGRA